MLKVLIVEDDLFFRAFLESKLMEYGKYEIVGVTDTVIGAINIIKAKIPDIILCDIRLKGYNNGLEIGSFISDRGIPIIFVTESQDIETYYRTVSIPLSSILIKPFHFLTLESTISSMMALKSSEIFSKGLVYSNGGVKQLISNDEIVFLKADRNYCTVYTSKAKFAYKISLSKIKDKLKKDIFIKVHKSYIINIKYVVEFDFNQNLVMLENNIAIPIGRTFKKSLQIYLKSEV